MRKVLLFLTALLTVGALNTNAQTFFCLSQTNGNQTIGGVTTTVTRSTPAPNSNTFCGAGPYQIGKDYSDWYNYAFTTPVTHARIQMVRLHDDDTVRIYVNGTLWDPTGNTSAYAGTCSQSSANVVTGPWGISTQGHQTGPGNGIQVNISLTPSLINSVRVEHARHADNNIASDVYYNMCFADDSCSLGFVATIDTPQCSGRDVQLDVTNMPNTTYSWTHYGTFNNPTYVPSTNVRNPTLQNVLATHSGFYVVTGTRGGCTYRDTVPMVVTTTPAVTQVTQFGPVCPFEDDTLTAVANLPTGGRIYLQGPLGLDSFNITSEWYIPTITNAYEGVYRIYAVGTQGCVSDTVLHNLTLKPDVTASFSYEVKEGCTQDTVIFTDNSTSGSIINVWWWRFDDPNGTISSNQNPTFYYPVPAIDTDANGRTYQVRLGVTNGSCFDTAQVNININHRIWSYFDMSDDSVCQGTTIDFTNSSFVKAATIPKYKWYFGDGTTDTTYDVSKTYNNSGVYTTLFTITDVLGCTDSFTRTLVVDSAGGIFFNVDKDEICLGEEVTFTGDFSAAGYLSIDWDFKDGVTIPDSTQVFHSYQEAGTYDVTFSADYRICPDTFFQRTINVKPYPRVYLGKDTTICPNGKDVVIGDLVREAGVTYTWHTPVEEVTTGDVFYVRHPGKYTVIGDLDGCTAADTLEVKKDCYINIPNVFTPNGDGNGDYFLPRQLLSKSVSQFEMVIFNRWGEKVFETTAIDGRGWDGKYGGEDLPIGVYIYQMKVGFANGVTERYQGNVTMLR